MDYKNIYSVSKEKMFDDIKLLIDGRHRERLLERETIDGQGRRNAMKRFLELKSK